MPVTLGEELEAWPPYHFPRLRALVFMGPSSINNIDVMTTVRIKMNGVQVGFIITSYY